MLKFNNIFKIIPVTIPALFLVTLSLLSINVLAADFVSGENTVNVSASQNNVYVSGGTVNVKNEIQKDLVIAGENITISAPVKRNIILAGGTVAINSPVGASVRAIGGQIDINTTIAEDVVVAGVTVTIKNAIIEGDLVVATSQLIIQNSVIKGNFYGSYSQLDGDLKSQIKGKIEAQQIDTNKIREEDKNAAIWASLNISGQISVLVFALIIYWLQKRSGKTELEEIKFNGQMGWDVGIGFLAVIVPFFLVAISGLFSLIPIIGTISLFSVIFTSTIWIYSTSTLSAIFVPIYLANLFRNSFGKNISVLNWVILSILGIFLINVIVALVPLLFILKWPIDIASVIVFGYVLRNLWNKIVPNKAELE